MSFLKKIYFDRQDKAVLALVNRILEAPIGNKSIFNPNLHPHGIEELVVPPVERMAYAVANLLRNLESGSGQSADRLRALRTLYDEVLNSAHSSLRRNTARVLMQIMKDMVRSYGDHNAQLRLAHDFRSVVHGTPRIVRRMLSKYHLPEMPEEWNQLAFDDHVYDVNTKGRKTPTHLIMDAWIKGLRSLTVAYEYCLDPDAASEILSAAEIMGIRVRIGLEFRVPFYDHFVNFFWIPRGFSSNEDFLSFLNEPSLLDLMKQGQEVLIWRKEQVLKMLDLWNTMVRPTLESAWNLTIAELKSEVFLQYCRGGNKSPQRLAECLHEHILPYLRERAQQLSKLGNAEDEIKKLDAISPDWILDEWFSHERWPQMPNFQSPENLEDAPKLLSLSPEELTSTVTAISGGYRLVLATTGLNVEDVAELLWDCAGRVTHLEIFNMKGWVEGQMADMESITILQQALNLGLGPRVKQLLRKMSDHLRKQGKEARAEKFQNMLHNIHALWEHYRYTPLKSRLGTSSSSRLSFGMGLVFKDTLPKRAQKKLVYKKKHDQDIPVFAPVEEQIIYRTPENPSLWQNFLSMLSFLPGCRHLGMESRQAWRFSSDEFRIDKNGNLVNLGGVNTFRGNHLCHKQGQQESFSSSPLYYLNNSVVNWLKVLLGFIPAFFSFYYVQDWWVLAWFGAFIWFGITGIRNVVQMVLTARGASRGTLVHWTKQVSVPRLCDSLMYTGISVLLLEVIVRVWLLEKMLGVTVEGAPFLVYTVLNAVNALYIFGHNIYRGFPKQAAIGNIFRSALSIPVASLYDFLLRSLLLLYGVENPSLYLVPSAAIISKLASDTVAAIIEGYADGQVNLRMRRWDYASKVKKVFDYYTRLELLFPQEDALHKLGKPDGLGHTNTEVHEIEQAFVVNSLDLMYFWFYQPRAQEALRQMLRSMSEDDRQVLAKAQLVLARERAVSQMLVDGLLGKNFSRPLAFFLDKHRLYLRLFLNLCRKVRDKDRG